MDISLISALTSFFSFRSNSAACLLAGRPFLSAPYYCFMVIVNVYFFKAFLLSVASSRAGGGPGGPDPGSPGRSPRSRPRRLRPRPRPPRQQAPVPPAARRPRRGLPLRPRRASEAATCPLRQRGGVDLPFPAWSLLLLLSPRFPHCSLAQLPPALILPPCPPFSECICYYY